MCEIDRRLRQRPIGYTRDIQCHQCKFCHRLPNYGSWATLYKYTTSWQSQIKLLILSCRLCAQYCMQPKHQASQLKGPPSSRKLTHGFVNNAHKIILFTPPPIWNRAQINKIDRCYVSESQTQTSFLRSPSTLENLNNLKWDSYKCMHSL